MAGLTTRLGAAAPGASICSGAKRAAPARAETSRPKRTRMSDTVAVERAGEIATVVLNRPDKLNVLDLAAWRALSDAFRRLDEDESLRCVVVRGFGQRAFSAGSDIAAFPRQRDTARQVLEYAQAIEGALTGILECRHPTVAQIRGACVGGGLEIAACCDLRVCGASSRFGAPINRLGLTMSHAELRPLIDLVGRSGVLEILLEGTILPADRALAMGLVNRVVLDDQVDDEALATARRIAEGAPLVNRWHKRFVRRLADPAPLSADEIAEGYAALETRDYRTGRQAFLEKRKPRFEGR